MVETAASGMLRGKLQNGLAAVALENVLSKYHLKGDTHAPADSTGAPAAAHSTSCMFESIAHDSGDIHARVLAGLSTCGSGAGCCCALRVFARQARMACIKMYARHILCCRIEREVSNKVEHYRRIFAFGNETA